MKRRKLLRAAATVSIVLVVVGAIVLPATHWAPANLISSAQAATTALWRWLRAATGHLTAMQLLEGAGGAWLVFVLALVAFARSSRHESLAEVPPAHVPHMVDTSDAPTITEDAPLYHTQMPELLPPSPTTPLPMSPAPHPETADYLEASSGSLHANASTGAAMVLPELARLDEQGIVPKELPTDAPGTPRVCEPRRNCGHVLALTGISLTMAQPLSYGLFFVAEAAGSPQSGSKASRRVIELIAEQITPALVNDQALRSGQLATLLKVAMLRASLDLRQQRFRTTSNLGVVVTGVVIVGDVVHVVNVGHCRTYVFRPSIGLRQITTDHSVVSCLVENGLLEPEALYTHPRRNQIYRGVGDGLTATAEVDTFEISVQSDDLLLLCSPGLWQALRQPQIEAILRADTDPRRAAKSLASMGASRTLVDDLHVIVVRPLGEWVPEFGVPAAQLGLP
jgi:serine/threonine protein phosphatase PrpC